MVPALERSLSSADFALPSAERRRALWARTHRALKEFLFGSPEHALLDAMSASGTRAHLAAFALLTLPLAAILSATLFALMK